MISELPIYRQILADTSLSPRDLQVWRAAVEYLDVSEARPLKHLVLEQHLRINRSTVYRSLDRLVAAGYLHRIRGRSGERDRLRVPLSRRDAKA